MFYKGLRSLLKSTSEQTASQSPWKTADRAGIHFMKGLKLSCLLNQHLHTSQPSIHNDSQIAESVNQEQPTGPL